MTNWLRPFTLLAVLGAVAVLVVGVPAASADNIGGDGGGGYHHTFTGHGDNNPNCACVAVEDYGFEVATSVYKQGALCSGGDQYFLQVLDYWSGQPIWGPQVYCQNASWHYTGTLPGGQRWIWVTLASYHGLGNWTIYVYHT